MGKLNASLGENNLLRFLRGQNLLVWSGPELQLFLGSLRQVPHVLNTKEILYSCGDDRGSSRKTCPCIVVVLFRDSLLPRPENGPGTQAGKERVLYYLQAHARNEPIRSQKIEQRRLLSDWLLKIVASRPRGPRLYKSKMAFEAMISNLCFFHRSFYTLKAVS